MDLEIVLEDVEENLYLYPALRIRLKIRNNSDHKVYAFGCNGIIKVMDKIVENINTINLCRLIGPRGLIDKYSVFIVCPPKKIHEIERLRLGRNLEIAISLNFQMYNYDTKDGKITDTYVDDAYRTTTISVIEWNELLDRLHYGKRRLIEIPNPKIIDDQPLKSGIELIEIAMDLLTRGHHGEAFNKCRLALDEIYPVFNSGPASTPVQLDSSFITQIDKDSTPAPKPGGGFYPNKSGYIDNLRLYIRGFAHLSHHGSYKITPEDAELVVYLCWDLISYLSKQLAISQNQWPTV